MFGIDLPAYHGPIDLLLYLIRREELPLEEISLSRITSQYLDYVSILQELDLDEVGEFIDITSQLIEMKAKVVLPHDEEETPQILSMQEPGDGVENLVDRLVQYKRFRDVASLLDEQSRQWQLRFPRLANDLPPRRLDAADVPIAKVEVWDLVSAFGRILKAKQKAPEHKLTYDNTPIHVYMERIHGLVRDHGEVELQNLFDLGMHKSGLVAMFLATLELTRHHGLLAQQRDADTPLMLVAGPSFEEVLQVAAVDNLEAEAVANSNMPVMPR
ncbi:segregation and condensation protein A [Pirellulaceae bacterium SH467]